MMRAKMWVDFEAPRGPVAARLRQQQHALLRRFRLPADLTEMLPGSLSLSHLRCGKPTCHCARGEGHPVWHLTYRAGGRTRVLHIPAAWVEGIRRRVEAGRAFQDAVRDVLAANAEMLQLTRRQRRR
jgi:hypothetical protein